MNVDHILDTLNKHEVAYILIGGMNYLLRHEPVLTFDVDLWIEDTPVNQGRCENALAALDAEWGALDEDWGPVESKPTGWLATQSVFCLTSPHGAIDIFKAARGLDSWPICRERAYQGQTAGGIRYVGLSDHDMLASQQALPEPERKQDRIRVLEGILRQRERHGD